jgi:sialic acid synthase SpsE
MSCIILDMGSGNTCHNEMLYAEKMIDTVAKMDSHKHKIIYKYQLWDQPQGKNEKLQWTLFNWLYNYAGKLGYKVTSSVFDIKSLKYLLTFDIPFVKLANRHDLWWLLGEVPRRIPVYISNYPTDCGFMESGIVTSFACVSKYPASLWEYELIPNLRYFEGISDHTAGLELYRKYSPLIWEKHYVLEHDESNLDGGAFAITPDELAEVIA